MFCMVQKFMWVDSVDLIVDLGVGGSLDWFIEVVIEIDFIF